MISLPLPPESAFSRAVFKSIRPHIPRERWPVDTVRGIFVCAGDGHWLDAEMEGFSRTISMLAADLVRKEGVDLVLLSPVAGFAAAVVRAKRWRDFCLYGFLPLLFAIPFSGALSEGAMRVAAAGAVLDTAALLLFQAVLARRRAAMAEARFIAHIPTPGLKINIGKGKNGGRSGAAEMPEV